MLMNPISISDSEWQIMHLVWEREPITTADVVAFLEESKGWHSRTTRTLLDRLVKKGALDQEKDGKRYLYSALVERKDCVRQERQSFVDRVFGGNSAAMILNVVRETKLSDQDIAELERLLKEKKE